jgi:hypothetical protein
MEGGWWRWTLKPGISVRGSGIGVTQLTAGPAGSCIDGYTVRGAVNATVTNLTIGNGAPGACGVGILNAGVGFATYRDVLISTSQATNTVAVMNDNSEVELIDVAMEIGQGSGTGDAIGVDQANGSSLSLHGSRRSSAARPGMTSTGSETMTRALA